LYYILALLSSLGMTFCYFKEFKFFFLKRAKTNEAKIYGSAKLQGCNDGIDFILILRVSKNVLLFTKEFFLKIKVFF
jgi:hypothetical protein